MGQLGDLSPEGSVALGILVGLVSTSVQSLGLTLQRKSHLLEEEKDLSEPRRPPYRRRRWQLGMAMFIISNLAGSTIQITTLPLPVLSTLQASGLVFNSICATLILGEPFTRWSLGGTILVCAGAVLIAIFGAIAEPAHNLDQLLALLGRKQFILWIIATAIVVVATIVGAKSIKYMNPWTNHSPRMRLFRGLAYGAVSGILSAHSLLVAKSAVELIVRTVVDHHNQFNRWQSWAILLCLLALALSQLYYLHRGLKLCSTSILYPFVFCVYNIIAILDGLIYFHETSLLTVLHSLLIALGTVILLLGVLALSWRLNNDPATKPPVAQNPLTPGLGFVDDESDSDAETVSLVDEEAVKQTPTYRRQYSPSSPFHLRTPTSKTGDLLGIRRTRRKGITEDIWDELEDEEPQSGDASPFSRFDHRRSSYHSPSIRREATASRGALGEDDTTATESTSLLKRSGTQRLYGDKRRRRSMPISTLGQQQRDKRRRSASSQEALGGWWKMKWWRGKVGGGQSKGKDRSNGDRSGEGHDPGGGSGSGGGTGNRSNSGTRPGSA